MLIESKISKIREIVKNWKKEGLTVGLVPTMGALHIGHESLIKKARQECDRVVVSIFVNPIQFGPNEDFAKYPRPMDKDSEICEKNGVDFIFHPEPEEMYPEKDHLTMVSPPEFFRKKLCGLTREGHFDGVDTVVLKLFNIVQPDKSYFGQKDAQQLIIIKKMVRDLNVPVEVIGCSIIRNEDGLACSSRNAYLSKEAKHKALTLYKTLKRVEELYKSGENDTEKLLSKASECLSSEIQLEYMNAYDMETFEQVEFLKSDTLIAIAVRVDGVRLIDNIMI